MSKSCEFKKDHDFRAGTRCSEPVFRSPECTNNADFKLETVVHNNLYYKDKIYSKHIITIKTLESIRCIVES